MDLLSRKNILTAIVAIILPVHLVFSSDWPTFMGDPSRSGYASMSLIAPFSNVWKYEIPGNIVSSPVVYKGIVYVTSRNGFVYAFNASDGNIVWDFSSDGYIDATAAVSSSTLVVPSMDGNLYALDRINGQLLWQVNLGAPSVSSPLIYSNIVYVGVGQPVNALKAFDLNTGMQVFSVALSQPITSAPSFCQGKIIFGADDGRIYAVSAESGDILFSYNFTGGAFEMNALACSDSIFSLPGHDERKVYKNSLADGSLLSYSTDLTDNLGNSQWNWQRVSSPLISTSTIYVSAGSDIAYLIGLDRQDLSVVKLSSVPLGSIGSMGFLPFMSMAGDYIFSGIVDGGLSVISSTGFVVQTISISTPVFSAPALADGKIFFCDWEGGIYAYKAAKYASFSNISHTDIISSTFSIKVDAFDSDANAWKLEFASETSPESFQLLSSSSYSGAELSSYEVFLLDIDSASLPNGNYIFKFSFINSPSQVYAITKVRLNKKPLPPTSLKASDNPNDNGNKINLTWSHSTSEVLKYRIYRSNGSGYSLLAQVSSNSVSYMDITAVTGTTFSYRISSWDGWLESDLSDEASAFSVNDNPMNDYSAPSKVTNLSCSPGIKGGSLILSFWAPGDDGQVGKASHYEIRYATFSFPWDLGYVWNSSRPVSGSFGFPEEETVSGLMAYTTYYFKLKAYDVALNGSDISNEAVCLCAIDTVAPSGISSFSVYDTPGDRGGRLTLSWQPSLDDGSGENDVYGYKVYRSTASGIYNYSSPYAYVLKGSHGWIDTAATANIKYFYTVVAYDSTNDSPISQEKFGISADNWRYVDFRTGGLLLSDDGAEILIPPNSLNQNDSMIMVRLDSNTLSPLSRINTVAVPTSIVYEVKFETLGTKLLNFAYIKIPYTDSEISGMNEENLRIYQKVGDGWRIVDGSMPLPSEKKVYAKINSLGIYSIMEYKPSGSLVSTQSVYTYPNPARGNKVVFKFMVSEKSNVKINIYNVAGEKVATLEKNNCPAGVFSEIEWNIKNIASGVYPYTLEAFSSSGSKMIKEKMAIIH